MTPAQRDERNRRIAEEVEACVNRRVLAEYYGLSLSRISEIVRGVSVPPPTAPLTVSYRPNGCAPQTLAEVGLFPDTGHAVAALEKAMGRPMGAGGVSRGVFSGLLVGLGWKRWPHKRPTVGTQPLERLGTAVIVTRDHALAVVGGMLRDSVDSRRKHVVDVWVEGGHEILCS